MRYPVALHTDDGIKYGATVPDIPGCFSAGDSIDECLEMTKQAIESHVEILAEDGVIARAALSVADYKDKEEYKGASWAFVDANVEKFSGKTEKINATIPVIVTTKIDSAIKKGIAKTRSGFLTEAALEKLSRLTN
jgi:predicted RNase H-like HicB family nuclease